MLVSAQGPALGRLMWTVTFAQSFFVVGLGNELLGDPSGIADGPAHITVSWGRLEGTQLLPPGTLARAGLRGTALHSQVQVQLCCVEMEVEQGRAVLVQREEGECMAPSQQAHLSQVGWGYKPRGEGGKEIEVPCVPLLSQGAQRLCFMLLSVQRQLTAGKEGVWLEPGYLSP